MSGPLDLSYPPDGDPGGDAADSTANAALGATTDAANTTGTTGSISGKLRGLVTILANVWDSVSGFFKVSLSTKIAGEDLTNDVQVMVQKPINAAAYAPSAYVMPGTPVAAANIKSTPGSVQSFMATNANAAVRYLQIHNKASTPSASEVPIRSFPIPAGTANNPGQILIDRHYLSSLIFCTAGVSFAFSTTYLTYTAATPADHFLDLNYV